MKTIQDITERINQLENNLELFKQSCDNQNEVKALCEEIALQYNNRGYLYYKSVEFGLAVNDYTSAIQLNSNLAVAFYNRATVHYRMGLFDKAVNDMKIAITLEPNNTEFQTGFQESLEQSQDCDSKS